MFPSRAALRSSRIRRRRLSQPFAWRRKGRRACREATASLAWTSFGSVSVRHDPPALRLGVRTSMEAGGVLQTSSRARQILVADASVVAFSAGISALAILQVWRTRQLQSKVVRTVEVLAQQSTWNADGRPPSHHVRFVGAANERRSTGVLGEAIWTPEENARGQERRW